MWLLPRMAAELGNSESTNIPCNSVCIYLSIYLYIYSIIYTYTDIGSPLQMDHATCFFWAKARNSMFFICVLLRAFTALSPHEHHVGEEKNGQKKRLHSLSWKHHIISHTSTSSIKFTYKFTYHQYLVQWCWMTLVYIHLYFFCDSDSGRGKCVWQILFVRRSSNPRAPLLLRGLASANGHGSIGSFTQLFLVNVIACEKRWAAVQSFLQTRLDSILKFENQGGQVLDIPTLSVPLSWILAPWLSWGGMCLPCYNGPRETQDPLPITATKSRRLQHSGSQV